MASILRKTGFAVTLMLLLIVGTKVSAANIAVVTPDSGLNLRTGPSIMHNIIRAMPKGTLVTILGDGIEWAPVQTLDGTSGYVAAQYIQIRPELSNRDGGASSVTIERLIEYSKTFIGTPYVYGGSSPKGFDCSGFTQYVFKNFGYSLARTAQSQYSAGVGVTKAQLQKGDLVFFGPSASAINHVGIYIGNNQFIHAMNYSKPLGITNLNSPYYLANYVGARRVLR